MISFTTANYVARETGYAMRGWGHGDETTNAAFAPLDTYGERFDAVCRDVRALGFDGLELWGSHLNPDWATDEHVALALDALGRHGLQLVSYACWTGPANVERVCELAVALGTRLVTAGYSGDPAALAPMLRAHGVVLAIENHPEERPSDLLAIVERGDGAFATTVDTGWWATEGYDPVRAIEELGAHVAHAHLKDVRHHGEPHVTCPWGEGVVDVEACVQALGRIGYEGAYTVEHEPEDHDPSEALAAMRARLEGWLR
jgi:L-ribulose-5-phosphate 3-epimerase